MLKRLGLIVVLIVLLIAVFCIFNARVIVKNKISDEKGNINKLVSIVKLVGTFVAILCLFAIYFIK